VKVKARDIVPVLKIAEDILRRGEMATIEEALAEAKDWVDERRLEEKLERL